MKVKIIIGEICSGKTTYSSSSFTKKDQVIDVGSIVRELTATELRTFDKDLDKVIGEKLSWAIRYNSNIDNFKKGQQPKNLAIVGIRQMSVLEVVEYIAAEHVGVENIEIIYLEVPVEIRKKRYEEREAGKDVSITFEMADKKDKELGLYALIQYIKHRNKTKIVKNY